MKNKTVIINYRLELKKWAKKNMREDGVHQLIYEFIKDGKLLDVEFKRNYEESGLDNYGDPEFDGPNDPVEVVVRCNNLKALNLSVDTLIANNITAHNLQMSYSITANNIKAVALGTGGICANNIEAQMVESLTVTANHIDATYIDIIDIENVKSLTCNVLISSDQPNENQKAKYYINKEIKNKAYDLF